MSGSDSSSTFSGSSGTESDNDDSRPDCLYEIMKINYQLEIIRRTVRRRKSVIVESDEKIIFLNN